MLAPGYRWSLRRLPGPFVWPLVFNLPGLLKFKSFADYMTVLSKTYGPVFRFFPGRRPFVVVTDLNLAKQVLTSNFSNFQNRRALGAVAVAVPEQDLRLDRMMLFHQGGEQWRILRAAWASYLSNSKGLAVYYGIMCG